jgi:selenocysteine-specific elongation factor
MHVIATAGHVDHGKSTLVRLLTGMEPDRWAEERRRGLTIDLGFAWTALDGVEVAFVDVPGHERFVPNMLAGVGPVPATMVVVAADEGWMPQSAEHLAALDALGVRHGLLVVSRCDLADPEPVIADAAARLASSSLGSRGPVPAVAVSGRTGAGLDDLRRELSALVKRLPAAEVEADVRLWIDRSFTIGGAGTVVTGTLAAGTLRTGDELVIASTGQRVRIRGLQSLNRPAAEVGAVARVAVNLRGVDRRTLTRGDALLTPDAWLRTMTVDVTLHPPSGETDQVPSHVVLHVGSAAVPARVRPLGDGPHRPPLGAAAEPELATGASVEPAAGLPLRLSLEAALPLRVGDRVLLRDPGQHRVVGGATVLDVRPPGLNRRGAARARAATLTHLASATPGELAAQQLRQRGFLRSAELRAMGLPVPPDPLPGGWHAFPETWAALVTRLKAEADAWRREHPLETGLPSEVARRRLALPDPALLEPLATAAGLRSDGGRIRRPADQADLPPALRAALGTITAELRRAPFAAPDAARLTELGLGPRELAAAVRAGHLLRIAEGVVLLPDALEHATRVLAALPQPFTASQARQALDTTRRVAIPLLELLDRRRITEQLPDSTRRLRPAVAHRSG